MSVEVEERCTCQKCGKTMDSKQFYTYKNGKKTELCKKCLAMHVDCFNPDTFTWILEKMDVPYVPQEWNVLRDKDFAKNPNKLSGMAVLGKYLSKMKLKQWSPYGWADSEKIIAENEQKAQTKIEIQKNFEKEIQQKYDEGKISEAQYKTLISTETQHEMMPVMADPPKNVLDNNPFNENNFISQDELVDPSLELTQEDKINLAMKWGRMYKPNEWIELERKYNEMMNSFDIQDSDTIGTLILICKTYLKMNQAIDIGD